MEFFDFAFWQNFASNSFATLLGVTLGIPVALLIDRLVNQWQEKEEFTKQKDALQQRKTQLLQTLKDNLHKNLALIEQMERELKPETVIFYSLPYMNKGFNGLKVE